MRLVGFLVLLVALAGCAQGFLKGWRKSATRYIPRNRHVNQRAIAPAPIPASGGTNPQPAPSGQDNKPSFFRDLAETGSKIAVESAVAGVIGVGISKAFSGSGEPAPPAAPAAILPAAAPAPPTLVKSAAHQEALPTGTGQQDSTMPLAATGSDAARVAVEQPRVEARPIANGSDAARRARVRTAVATSVRSSACSTSPLMAAVSTALVLVLSFAAEW